MRKLAALSMLLAMSAWAGDRLLGVLLVTDGGTVSNATTGYLAAGCDTQTGPNGAGACPQAFPIGTNVLLSVQCKDQGALFKANAFTVDAGDGIRLAADQFFLSSTGSQSIIVGPRLWADAGVRTYGGVPDGGVYVGGVVAIAPLSGAARAECNIYQPSGTE